MKHPICAIIAAILTFLVGVSHNAAAEQAAIEAGDGYYYKYGVIDYLIGFVVAYLVCLLVAVIFRKIHPKQTATTQVV